jgi:hypothetical protein
LVKDELKKIGQMVALAKKRRNMKAAIRILRENPARDGAPSL